MLTKLFGQLRGLDWELLTIVCILTAVGLATIYSIDLSRGTSLVYFPVQSIAFGIGIVLLMFAASVHEVFYQSLSRLLYLAGLLALIGVLFFGVTIRGTTGWFRFAGFSFQPAELAKVALILFLAWLMYAHARRFDRWQFVVGSGLVTALYAGLILLQPDLGSALIIVGIWFGLLCISGTKKRYIVFLIVLALSVFAIAWSFLFAEYQRDRLRVFLDPSADPLGAGYNVTQSIIAVGAGGFFGRGLGFGSQSQLHFLPEAQTDFIFSVIAEELGFLGVFAVFTLYFLLLWRLLVILRGTKTDFSSFVILGILFYFFIHIVVNIGATIGLLPVTGVTLPFLSYGGSSLIMNFFLIGIAESVTKSERHRDSHVVEHIG